MSEFNTVRDAGKRVPRCSSVLLTLPRTGVYPKQFRTVINAGMRSELSLMPAEVLLLLSWPAEVLFLLSWPAERCKTVVNAG